MSSKQGRRLGRGLASIMGDTGAAAEPKPVPVRGEPAATPDMGSDGASAGTDDGLVYILIGSLEANPYQPRTDFDARALEELSGSISARGMMQPIVVRSVGGGRYQVVAGERRWRAAQMASLERVPAIVRSMSDQDAAEFALIENLQREDLGPVERGRSFRRLMDVFGLTQEDVAARVGISRPAVANAVRLLDLGDAVLAMVEAGELSGGHGKVLLGVEDPDLRLRLAMRAVSEGLSVRALEEAVRGSESAAGGGKVSVPRAVSPAVADLQGRLCEHLGTEVRIRTDRGGTKGRVEIRFFDLDQFDGLLDRIGLPRDES